ncbi:hypothetical protein [Phenylobacterium sp.]|uniref:hypothetical protein n=1 Tax=Phenylobacterium sp. TaxID=1871053 RepID=UPI0025F26423|nr:hypothetical protein [Phenylobacterium sp.]
MSTEDFTPDEIEIPETRGELVQWMGRGPLRIGPADVSAKAVAAFVLGVAAAVAVLAAHRWRRGPRR